MDAIAYPGENVSPLLLFEHRNTPQAERASLFAGGKKIDDRYRDFTKEV